MTKQEWFEWVEEVNKKIERVGDYAEVFIIDGFNENSNIFGVNSKNDLIKVYISSACQRMN